MLCRSRSVGISIGTPDNPFALACSPWATSNTIRPAIGPPGREALVLAARSSPDALLSQLSTSPYGLSALQYRLLPFLPMLTLQILLNNLLYDFSRTGILFDHVDPEYLMKPRQWKLPELRPLMSHWDQ